MKSGRQRYEKSEPGGLHIRVYPSGHKAYLWRYRDPGGTQRVFTLGEWPHMKLTEARRRLAEAKALRETGTDPAEAAAEKRETRRDTFRAKRLAPTVADILDEYMTRHVTKHCRPATVAEFGRLIAINLNPACGRMKAREATRSGIVGVLDRIADTATPSIADHAEHVLAAAFNFAVKRGRLELSPCQALPKHAQNKPRDRTLTSTEIKTLWQTLDAHKGVSEPVALALKLLLLTGQRRGSLAVAEWSEFETDRWTIPAGQTNSVPLPPLAQETLERLRTAADYTVHDLRRTAATLMGEAGVSRFVIARVLGHTDTTMTGVYDRYEYQAEKRRALETLARKVGEIIGQPKTAIVVALR